MCNWRVTYQIIFYNEIKVEKDMETFFLKEKYKNNNDSPLSVGDKVVISNDPNEVNHIKKSKRKQKGDLVDLIDGKGNRYLAKIMDISVRNSVSFEIVEDLFSDKEKTVDYNNEIDLTIAVSMLNNSNRLKMLLEKLTELGVANFQPFLSERSTFAGKKTPNLEEITISALKQCKGNTLINLKSIVTFEELLKEYERYDKYFCNFDGVNFVFSSLINKSDNEKESANKIIVLIGPEGGFSENEIDVLKNKNYKSISLNRRVLRAETAAIVAASRILL